MDELFDMMAVTDIGGASDELLIINPDTRQIEIPGNELVFGVEGDVNGERKYFACPRIVGNNIDLATCFVRANYRNANGEMDFDLIDDLTVSGDNVLFSWEVSGKAVAYKGQVKFNISFDRPGNDPVSWHTTVATGMSLEGAIPDVEAAVAAAADGMAQLLAKVDEQIGWVEAAGEDQIIAVEQAASDAEAASVAEIEAKGENVRASIPDDYTALSEAVGVIQRGMAPGIVCEAEGAAITLDDASNMAMQGMRIFGKSTQDGVPTPEAPVEIKSVENPTVTVAGKNLFHLGTFSGTQSSWNEVSFPAGEYTFSAIATSNDTDSTTCLVLVYEDRQKLVEKRFSRGVRESLTFTVTGTLTHIILYASNTNNNSAGDTFEFADTMLEVNSEATAYDPYKPVQTIELTHTLPGIPVTSGGNYTDSDGQQWICDEVDFERGVYVHNCWNELVTFSPENDVNGVRYRAYLTYHTDPDRNGLIWSNKLSFEPNANPGVNGIRVSLYSTNLAIAYFDGKVIDEAVVLYPLATPIETPLSETELAAWRSLHTNKPNTAILNDAGAHMAVEYVADTKLYIDKKIAALTA